MHKPDILIRFKSISEYLTLSKDWLLALPLDSYLQISCPKLLITRLTALLSPESRSHAI